MIGTAVRGKGAQEPHYHAVLFSRSAQHCRAPHDNAVLRSATYLRVRCSARRSRLRPNVREVEQRDIGNCPRHRRFTLHFARSAPRNQRSRQFIRRSDWHRTRSESLRALSRPCRTLSEPFRTRSGPFRTRSESFRTRSAPFRTCSARLRKPVDPGLDLPARRRDHRVLSDALKCHREVERCEMSDASLA